MPPTTVEAVLFCSLAVLGPRVGHTMDVLSPFIFVLCHSDWLFHGESYPRVDVNQSRSYVAFLAYVHLSLFLALSLSPGNSLVSSWCDHSILASLLWRCVAGVLTAVESGEGSGAGGDSLRDLSRVKKTLRQLLGDLKKVTQLSQLSA